MKHLSFFISVFLLSSSAIYGMGHEGPDAQDRAVTAMQQEFGFLKLPSAESSKPDDSGSSSAQDSAKAIQAQASGTPYVRCYFNSDIRDAFLQCVSQEQKGMRGAFYRFTLYDVAQCIVRGMAERKISANLVIDGDHFKKEDSKNQTFKGEFCSPLKLIVDNGGSVYAMSKPRFQKNMGHFETMHQKFMIFESVNGKKLLWQGSWNATGQASLKNSESVMVIDDQDAIKVFEQEYEKLLLYSDRVTSAQCITKRDTEISLAANFARRMNGIPEIQ